MVDAGSGVDVGVGVTVTTAVVGPGLVGFGCVVLP